MLPSFFYSFLLLQSLSFANQLQAALFWLHRSCFFFALLLKHFISFEYCYLFLNTHFQLHPTSVAFTLIFAQIVWCDFGRQCFFFFSFPIRPLRNLFNFQLISSFQLLYKTSLVFCLLPPASFEDPSIIFLLLLSQPYFFFFIFQFNLSALLFNFQVMYFWLFIRQLLLIFQLSDTLTFLSYFHQRYFFFFLSRVNLAKIESLDRLAHSFFQDLSFFC